METIKLTIPNMKSPHCQMTVTNVVKGLGASVKNMQATQTEIELAGPLTKQTLINAIEKAGYRVENK
jgi:copper chaperone CopZ